MLWKIALALIEVATILARQVAASRAQEAAEAQIFVKNMEKANAAIARAKAAAARAVAGANSAPGGVRARNRNARD